MHADKFRAINEARRVFHENNLTAGFDTVEFAKQLGFTVKKGSYNPVDFGGKSNTPVTGAIDYQTKTIYVNQDDCIERRRFTIAHELGHYFLHKPDNLDNENRVMVDFRGVTNNPKETEANYFASELLMPKDMIKEFIKLNSKDGSFYLSDFKKDFVVSEESAKYRLKREGFNIE